MKTLHHLLLSGLAVGLCAAAPCPVTPFNLSLVPAYPLYPPHYSVAGLRLNFFEIRNAEVFGLDLGLQQHSDRFGGVQLAVLSANTQNADGIQIAGGSADTLAFRGLQIAGAIAEAEKVNGLQLTAGLAYSENLTGLQCALLAAESQRTGLDEEPPARLQGLQLAGWQAFANQTTGLQLALAHAESTRSAGIQVTAGLAETRGLHGLQIGGAALSGPVSGLQISPTLVRANGPLRGLQAAVLLSAADHIETGIQLAGITARSRGPARRTAQIALFNTQAESLSGLQLAAGAAQSGSTLSGLQAGLVYNDAPSVTGMQVGLINRCGELNGLQIGLINLRTDETGRTRFLPLLRIHRRSPEPMPEEETP